MTTSKSQKQKQIFMTSIPNYNKMNNIFASMLPQSQQRHQQQSSQKQQLQQQKRQQQDGERSISFTLMTMLTIATITIVNQMQVANAADLVINIPEISANENAFYRIDYTPPVGYPEPNTTISAQEIGKELKFSRALPGTKYDFLLFYTNSTHRELLTWTVGITTAPDPPANLSVQVRSSKNVLVTWTPPKSGNYSGFRLDVIGLTEPPGTVFNRTYIVNNTFQHSVKELTSGASYQLQVYSIYDGKESVAYASRNFTTKPNTPGKFIVWFRNETTLLVLWQPPFPAGIYTHYKVSIEPPDAQRSELYVEREGEPPGPAQAAFKGLVPGRAYNISVQTMSEDVTSVPTTARYLTVPVRPMNVTFDKEFITTNSFRVSWHVPQIFSEYDNFQVSLASSRRQFYVPRTNATTTYYDYREYLEPGKTYSVVVKTISVNVNSWPATGEVTLRPLPVKQLRAFHDDSTNVIHASWEPDETSTQNAYRVVYFDTEEEHTPEDNQTIITNSTEIKLDKLKSGRRYRINVQALSNNMTSNSSKVLVDTRPAAPLVVNIKSIPMGLNISWQSDINSKQDKYEVLYSRNGTSEVRTVVTNQTQLVIKNLQPGAGYEIKVYANSHNLRSELHSYFQAVYPKPPRNLTIETLDSSSIQLRWLPPDLGEFSEYSVRFCTESEQWQRLPNVHDNKVTIKDMRRGERYTVQVNTVSFGIESISPLEINTTMLPQPVSNVVSLVDAHNLTLEWPAHDGRVDYYIIRWWSTDKPNDQMHKNVTDQSVVSAPLVHVPISDLMPGTQYNFEIQANSYGLNSAITQLPTRTMPLIQSDVFVANGFGDEAPNSLILTYTPTPTKSTKFDVYRFSLGEADIKDKEKSANDTDRKVVFSNLVPGRLYNITVWTLSGGVASVPIQRQDRLYPQPVSDLQVTAVSERQVTLHWQLPQGEYTDFEVQYFSEIETLLLQNVTLTNEITISDLLPHHNYTFTVVVRSGTESSVLRSSAPHSVNVTTKEAPPGRVEYFQPIDVQPSEITFEWFMHTREMNGILRHFIINYYNENNSNDSKKHIVIEPNMGVYTLKGLTPGGTYVFTIQASNGLGYGAEREHRQTMPILAPPCTDPDVAPTEVTHSAKTIKLRFRKNYFSDVNGAVRKYSIIVAEDVSKNASGLEIPSWQDVQSYNVWLPYQAAESYYPFVNDTVEDFVIGGEDCNAASMGFCNGPLKSGTTYRVKVRAFTDDDKFTDTAYSSPIHTDNDDTAIYLTVGLVLLSCVLTFGFLCYCTRRMKPTKQSRLRTSFPMPEPRQTSRPVHLTNFAEYCRLMSVDSDYRFSEQFEDLKLVGRDQPCTFADLPCNRPKNRFTNILPYDHSRYKLQPVDDDEGSDYINANYVPGYNSPREFIVTQGPLPSTREEFWRMCWESNSPAIIMLTRCIEKGRDKCDQYWPTDRLSIFYGDIKVQLINDAHFVDWVISEFMVSRGGEQRVIRHFHFTTWPDFGVPDPPETLVSFVRTVRNAIGIETRPIVVHCSAGVGRSGTFIALDHIMHQIQMSEYADIFGVVHNMRKERILMVQTEQQYICIHECLLSLLHSNQQSLVSPPEVQERPAAAPEETASLKQQEQELLSKFYAQTEKLAKDTKLLYAPLPEYTKINILDEDDDSNFDGMAADEKYAKQQHIKDHDYDHSHSHDDDNKHYVDDDEDDDDDDDDDDDVDSDDENTTTSVGIAELETEAEEDNIKNDKHHNDNGDDDDDDGVGDDGVGIDESPLLVDEGIAETNM